MSDRATSSGAKAGDPARAVAAAPDPALEQVLRAIKGLRFGEVRVVVQDGSIVQIDRLEKHRLR